MSVPTRDPSDPILDRLARRVAFAERFSYEATIAPFFRDLVRARKLRRAAGRVEREAA